MVYDFDTLRTAAQRAPLGALADLASQMYAAHGAGLVSDEQAETIEGVIAARRAEAKPAAVSLGAALARKSIFPVRRLQRSPDRTASFERARRLAYSGPMPAALAARFTPHHLAVLQIVALEVAQNGQCDLALDTIAAKAGVCRRSAQAALRLAEGDGLLTITERPRRGAKSDTNVVRIVSREWQAWIARGHRRVGCKPAHPTNTRDQFKGRLSPSEAAKESAERAERGRRRASDGSRAGK